MKDIERLWLGSRLPDRDRIRFMYKEEMGFEVNSYLELTRYYIHKLESNMKSIEAIIESTK